MKLLAPNFAHELILAEEPSENCLHTCAITKYGHCYNDQSWIKLKVHSVYVTEIVHD